MIEIVSLDRHLIDFHKKVKIQSTHNQTQIKYCKEDNIFFHFISGSICYFEEVFSKHPLLDSVAKTDVPVGAKPGFEQVISQEILS